MHIYGRRPQRAAVAVADHVAYVCVCVCVYIYIYIYIYVAYVQTKQAQDAARPQLPRRGLG